MLDWLIGGLGGIWSYVVAGLAALAGILALLFSAKKAGKDEVRAEVAKKEVEDVKKANEVERSVATAKPDDRRGRLLDRWSRD